MRCDVGCQVLRPNLTEPFDVSIRPIGEEDALVKLQAWDFVDQIWASWPEFTGERRSLLSLPLPQPLQINPG